MLLAEQVAVVSDAASEDLEALWRLPTAEIRAALLDVLPGLIDTWASAAGTLAADWYDQEREDAEIKGRFRALVPDLGDLGGQQLAGWAATALDTEVPDLALTRSRVEGGMHRRIANTARATVATSSVQDPQARGWQRIARADACAFCLLIASRGGVYTKATSDFASHDDCSCSATPSWKDRPIPVKPYRPSDRNITEADRARVGQWIKDNDDSTGGKVIESASDIAKRQLPGLEKSLADLRAKGLPEGSPQIQYHLAQIAKFRKRI